MKTQSAELIAEQAKKEVTVFRLLKIGASYCYTDFHDGITYNGDTYIYYTFQLPEFKSSDGSPLDGGEIQLGTGNTAGEARTRNNAILNAPVTVYEQWYAKDMSLIATECVFSGKVDGKPGLTEEWATIIVAAHLNPWTQRFPRRRISRANFPFLPTRGTRIVWLGNVFEVE